MDGLRKQGLAALSRLGFVNTPNEHELITVDNSTGSEPTRVSMPLDEILHTFEGSPDPVQTIRIVKLHIRHPVIGRGLDPPVINASKEHVRLLWGQFNLDPSVFQLLAQGVRGFYQHHTTSARNGDSQNKQSHYVICSYVYCLIWTYIHQTQTTNAVMIARPGDHLGRIDFDQWFSVLGTHTSLAQHPLCLFLTTIMQTMHVATAGAQGAQALINDIEWRTGFYPWMSKSRPQYLERRQDQEEGDMRLFTSSSQIRRLMPSNNLASNMTLDDLSIASRNIGAVPVILEDHFRVLQQLQLAIKAFNRTHPIPGGAEAQELQEEEEESVQQALCLYSQQIDSCNIRLHNLRERGKNQSTVVSSLMTRADTQASISLAKSAKKDSSSMKVIAVMTMTFLPATFLAALFAVPSLKWDAETVMQDNFWVFWAFALPATALTFGLWFLLAPNENSDASLMDGLLSRFQSRRTKSCSGAESTSGDRESAIRNRPTAATETEATIQRVQNFMLNRGGNFGDLDLELPERSGTTGYTYY
ncbi:hypothetical protein QBC37DRAFT_481888 [Rhypophila decipiens]|uniref:Uncharacterized protein n=1 Tax=Rhypophila decipiens TaxID=261697 RepID=A0AAN7B6V2_9PEZI|nr:hypothetical protein QBC37DRAFT_481888 [Rhypophila decipiens]